MRVLRESNIDFDEIPLTTEEVKEEEVKVEILKEGEIEEEVIDVEEVGFELSLTDGASAKVEIDYDKLHEDIKSNFESVDDGSEVAEFTLDTFNGQSPSQHAFHHDHNYLGGSSKEGPAILGERSAAANRRRNVSESSGYSSMAEEQATISSRCRDEKMAKKMNLPFSTWEVINSPVDTFSEMLARPGLTSEQVKLCRDIRRRGKNKVAAQNCRKRKLDTIEELQSQVGQVQRRKAQLLREREQLEAERARWSSKLSYLEETVLAGAGKSFGMFTLEVTDNAVVVTRSNQGAVEAEIENSSYWWNTNETKKQDLQYSPETGDLPTTHPHTRFILQKKPHQRSSSALCHILAYILLILLTYIASCIVFCHFRAKSSSDEEDFRTTVTLAPDLGGPFQILEPALAVFRCK